MPRIHSGLAQAQQDPDVVLVLDLNPDLRGNQKYVRDHVGSGGDPQERLKQHLRAQGMDYYSVTGLEDSRGIRRAVHDFIGNHLPEGKRFVVLADRQPLALEDALGLYAPQCAGYFCE